MSITPIADALMKRWEATEAERRKAVGPNPKVVSEVAAGNFLDLVGPAMAIYQKLNFGRLD